MINISIRIARIAIRSCATLDSSPLEHLWRGDQWCVCARDFSKIIPRERVSRSHKYCVATNSNVIPSCTMYAVDVANCRTTYKCHFSIRRCCIVCKHFQASSIRIHFVRSQFQVRSTDRWDAVHSSRAFGFATIFAADILYILPNTNAIFDASMRAQNANAVIFNTQLVQQKK